MDLGPGAGDRRDVAVGPSAEVAARVFGGRFDNALVTTYDAFDGAVDLATVATVGVVAGPGLVPLVDRLRAHDELWPGRVLVGLPEHSGHAALDDLLAADPSVAVAAVDRSGGPALVALGRSSDVPPQDSERLLRQLRTPPAMPRAAPTATLPLATVPPPGGVLAGLRSWDRRHLVALAAAVALIALLVVAAVLVAIGQSDAGAHGVLVTVVLATALAQVLTVLGVLYAIRSARHTRAAVDEQHQQLRARTDRLVRLAKEAAGRDKQTGRDLEQLQQEVLALGRLMARSRVEARERGE